MDSTDKLIALLQARNTAPVPITREAVEFLNVQAIVAPGFNTQATVQAVPGHRFTDSKVIRWNRIDLAAILNGSGLLSDGPLTAQDVVDKVNANWETWLTLEDLEAFTPPDTSDGEIHDLVLTARADSLGWYGTVTLAVSRPSMSVLNTLMTVTLPNAFGSLV